MVSAHAVAEPERAAWLLAFDIAELTVLLFFTGGLENRLPSCFRPGAGFHHGTSARHYHAFRIRHQLRNAHRVVARTIALLRR
jgi:hypothetical protein